MFLHWQKLCWKKYEVTEPALLVSTGLRQSGQTSELNWSLTVFELDWEDWWLSHFSSQAAEDTEVESSIAWGGIGPDVENWLGSDKSGDR